MLVLWCVSVCKGWTVLGSITTTVEWQPYAIRPCQPLQEEETLIHRTGCVNRMCVCTSVCICMCLHKHVCVCTFLHKHVCVYVCAYLYVFTHAWHDVCVYGCLCVCVYLYVFTHACVYVSVCACMCTRIYVWVVCANLCTKYDNITGQTWHKNYKFCTGQVYGLHTYTPVESSLILLM